MALPISKSKIDKRFCKQKFVMLGASKIGKSDFFSQEENSFFIEAEAGLNHLSVNKLPARNWEDLRGIYADLKQADNNGKFPYSLIVVDTIDKVVDYAEEEIIAKGKEFYKTIQINTIADLPNGAGWSRTRGLVTSFLDKLVELPCAIAIISHLTIKRIEEGVNKFDKSTISLWSSMGGDILAWADHTLHIEARMVGDRLIRIVYTKPTQTKEAGSRGNMIPDRMQWTENAKDNYNNFRKLFE